MPQPTAPPPTTRTFTCDFIGADSFRVWAFLLRICHSPRRPAPSPRPLAAKNDMLHRSTCAKPALSVRLNPVAGGRWRARMQICRSKQAIRDCVADWRGQGQRVALVATMGALHQGHMRLLDHARDWLDARDG
ncbi:pantoate--beta-alanine ligase, partial [Paracoccus sp. (in: a-proteobacteria)]|uniref:pantoate--beta-alanine ligase n=1 Tax=Paracoccus sp. TaxID=267 RepID=UPI0040584019